MFKLNDWVVSNCTDKPYLLADENDVYVANQDRECCNIKLWIPVKDEFIWVWCDGEVPRVMKFKHMSTCIKGMYVVYTDDIEFNEESWRKCSPFIGEPPQSLRSFRWS